MNEARRNFKWSQKSIYQTYVSMRQMTFNGKDCFTLHYISTHLGKSPEFNQQTIIPTNHCDAINFIFTFNLTKIFHGFIIAHFITDDSAEDRKWWRERQNGVRKCHKTAGLNLWPANAYKSHDMICYLKIYIINITCIM